MTDFISEVVVEFKQSLYETPEDKDAVIELGIASGEISIPFTVRYKLSTFLRVDTMVYQPAPSERFSCQNSSSLVR